MIRVDADRRSGAADRGSGSADRPARLVSARPRRPDERGETYELVAALLEEGRARRESVEKALGIVGVKMQRAIVSLLAVDEREVVEAPRETEHAARGRGDPLDTLERKASMEGAVARDEFEVRCAAGSPPVAVPATGSGVSGTGSKRRTSPSRRVRA